MKNCALALATCWLSLAALAADSDKAGRCIAVAYAMQKPKAADDALAVADNQRVAIAAAELAMKNLKRTKGTVEQDAYAGQYIDDCYKIGVKVSRY